MLSLCYSGSDADGRQRCTCPVLFSCNSCCTCCVLQTTVREALVNSAMLRLYHTRERGLIESFVDDVMQLVELTPNRDALVRQGQEV